HRCQRINTGVTVKRIIFFKKRIELAFFLSSFLFIAVQAGKQQVYPEESKKYSQEPA
ncbi:MAG: hypothetical protein JG781_1884, partial [Peptococcaceae bacterium]|nr:hypothetical protein [Peptococcaceae bacterium]